jgi:auxin-responsive protein IAA
MEEGSIKREVMPQLLDLIPDEKQWNLRGAPAALSRSRNTAGFEGDEDKKLELKLGLPGLAQEETAGPSRESKMHQESPALSLGYLPTTTTGAKRGFLDTVEAKAQGNKQLFSSLLLGTC